ncbi:hypothetical protein BSU04_30030 [Caballeronia sordidicola]|uniref:Uncharacterized protein n=1 Tax=Caballeronia sordidicola TaxID=196367 RepID=A0A226WUQ9_CABSO|nr:hypothetical protein BSU04_30030 [Caballeronia sordidicola]
MLGQGTKFEFFLRPQVFWPDMGCSNRVRTRSPKHEIFTTRM